MGSGKVLKSGLEHLKRNHVTCRSIFIYTVMAKNIGTFGKYDQRRL